MNSFSVIKEKITVPQAAEFYGIKSKNGMCRCIFHVEKTPSMKLYPHNYHCFGCGEHGDVINLVEYLFELESIGAAKKLNEDFGLGLDLIIQQ